VGSATRPLLAAVGCCGGFVPGVVWGVGWGFVFASTFPAWLPGFFLALFFCAGCGACGFFLGTSAGVLLRCFFYFSL